MKVIRKSVVVLLLFVMVIFMFSAVGINTVDASENYLWPVPANKTITYGRGYYDTHKGIDIGGNTSYDIVATKSGTVVRAFTTGCKNQNAAATGISCSEATCSYNNPRVIGGVTVCNFGFGRGVILQHSDGSYSCYAHMSRVDVKKGDSVRQGEVIGKMGNYGYSSGVHLHFALTGAGNNWDLYNINPEAQNYVYADIFNIAYNSNGGSGTIVSSTISSGATLNIAKSGFSRLGYTLTGFNVYRKSDKSWYTSGGWATASEISSGGYTKKFYALGDSYPFNSVWTDGAVAGDTYTFYAVWTKNIYTIGLEANGGEGAWEPFDLTVNSTLTIPENVFTREGYYFAGYNCYRFSDKKWYNYPNGWLSNADMKNSGYAMRVYMPGESFNLGSAWINASAGNDTFIFYPIWKPEKPTVTFYENFGGANYMTEGIIGTDEVFAANYYSRDTSVYTITRDNNEWLNNQPSIKIVAKAVGENKKDFYFDTDTNKGIDVLGYAPDEKEMTLSFWAKGTADGAKLSWRWGYTTDYYSVTLTNEWKRYSVDVSKNMYDSDGLYFYLDKIGTFYMNNLCLRDNTSSEFFKQETGGFTVGDSYEYGKTYSELPTPKREGYVFKGWYTAKNGGTEVTADTDVYPYNINLYAHWEKEFSDEPIQTLTDDNGKKYELYDNTISWEEAKNFCESKGGHLVTINSQEENELVLSMIEDNDRFTWIGASYDVNTDSWNWVTDEPFEYTNWNTGEPSVALDNREYYVHMFSIDTGISKTKGKWNDISGSSSFSTYYGVPNSMYVCEYESSDTYIAGDVNMDGCVDILDVFIMVKHEVNYIKFDEKQICIADVNQDGLVDVFDLFIVARYNAGYISDLPEVVVYK